MHYVHTELQLASKNSLQVNNWLRLAVAVNLIKIIKCL